MTQDKTPELKACPFCGGDARLEVEQFGQDAVCYAFCLRCNVEGETWRSDNWAFSKKKAAEAWNTRPAEAQEQKGDVAVWRVVKAAQHFIHAVRESNLGKSPQTALPAEYDTLVHFVEKFPDNKPTPEPQGAEVAEAVKILSLLDGHDLWIEEHEYPEDGADGYRQRCPVRKEEFKKAKETLIQSATRQSQQHGRVDAMVKALEDARTSMLDSGYAPDSTSIKKIDIALSAFKGE